MTVEQKVRERLAALGVSNPSVEVEEEFLVKIVLPADSTADLRQIQSEMNALDVCVTRLVKAGEA
ncbi:MAG: hypothetical protein KME03_14605 [Aphanocapsa lilacina HA4352-LM1]|jgi:hypothetical protein|uniref:Gsr3400 protein n=1 Tax=Gloeobacter violaceus (strain ATCC 29082 / PCC 7421) TaxID=251221 RepID=Q7NFX4_GLOVI|nr:hypothetical protein [Gloeobacter violaceus]MBW4699099.1 hypothetical protein [Aphanocapsa lilacina HA4352-LM1]BAC91341.1 gsr3400 [Gloeobacter violaceus PCC 7421]